MAFDLAQAREDLADTSVPALQRVAANTYSAQSRDDFLNATAASGKAVNYPLPDFGVDESTAATNIKAAVADSAAKAAAPEVAAKEISGGPAITTLKQEAPTAAKPVEATAKAAAVEAPADSSKTAVATTAQPESHLAFGDMALDTSANGGLGDVRNSAGVIADNGFGSAHLDGGPLAAFTGVDTSVNDGLGDGRDINFDGGLGLSGGALDYFGEGLDDPLAPNSINDGFGQFTNGNGILSTPLPDAPPLPPGWQPMPPGYQIPEYQPDPDTQLDGPPPGYDPNDFGYDPAPIPNSPALSVSQFSDYADTFNGLQNLPDLDSLIPLNPPDPIDPANPPYFDPNPVDWFLPQPIPSSDPAPDDQQITVDNIGNMGSGGLSTGGSFGDGGFSDGGGGGGGGFGGDDGDIQDS